MKTAIILPARNEGAEVALTIESVKDEFDSICVVDDSSQDGSCDSLPGHVDLVRNRAVQGPAFCRNQAFLYDVDCFVFADAHIRQHQGSLRQLCETALEKNAIMNASVMPLEGKRQWVGNGGRMTFDGECIDIKYNMGMSDGIGRVGGLIGACYAIPSNIFRHLGGWPETVSWGYNEQALTIAAAMMGVPMYCDPSMIIKHKFKKVFNYSLRKTDTLVNRWLVHYLFFSEATWRGYWEPIFRAKHPERTIRCARKLLKTQAVIDARAKIQAKKVIDDDQFFKLLESGGFAANRGLDS